MPDLQQGPLVHCSLQSPLSPYYFILADSGLFWTVARILISDASHHITSHVIYHISYFKAILSYSGQLMGNDKYGDTVAVTAVLVRDINDGNGNPQSILPQAKYQ